MPVGIGAAVLSVLAALGITLAPDAQTELKIVVDSIVGAIVALNALLSHNRQKHAVEVNAALTAKHLVVQQKQAEATTAVANVQAAQVQAASQWSPELTVDVPPAGPDAGPPEPLVVTSDPAAGVPVIPATPPV